MSTCKKVFLLTACVFVISSPVMAGEPYKYLNGVIESLQLCNIAGERLKSAQASNLFEHMKNMQVFIFEIEIAANKIAPYIQSSNDIIKESSSGMVLVYAAVIRNNKQFINILEEVQNNPQILEKTPGTLNRRMSENVAESDQIWRGLLPAVLMSTYSLIDYTRSKYLVISSRERTPLRNRIIQVFGDQVKGGMKAGQLPIAASGAVLWKFLDDGWISSDEN